MAPKFEIHIENWNHALHVVDREHDSGGIFYWLIPTLAKRGIRPHLYALKDYEEEQMWGAFVSKALDAPLLSHGTHHYHDEKADRSPYFNQEGLPWPPSGGFFFRIMPLWYLRWAIKKSGLFWIHPHDLDESHPKVKNWFLNWKRHVGLKNAKKKLEALLASIDNWY